MNLNNELHAKVDVESLRIGMFVADLDREWRGTPFLLQGFLIESDEELDQLREYCGHVFVDPARSTVPVPMSMEEKPPPAAVATEAHEAQVRRGAPPDLRGQADPLAFRRELGRAARVRSRAHQCLKRAFEDVRLGASVDTDEARAVVSDLIESITVNVNASLWLTNLKDKDEYTSIHSMNVCILAVAFGRHLGLSEDDLKVLGLGALLHDIGKIKTPPEVLNKPGRLSPAEFDIMRRHPVEGFELIRNSDDRLPAMALQIIRHHHERLAGNGYPDGWSGDQIPLPVQITSLVDVYDAVTSDRCYHTGMPAHKGLRLLYQIAPKDFPRELVEEFIRCIGIYPIGSLVKLTTGDLGVVLSADPMRRLKPLIRLIRDADGKPYPGQRLVNLSDLADSEANWRRWGVAQVLDPADHGIDVKALVAEDFDPSALSS